MWTLFISSATPTPSTMVTAAQTTQKTIERTITSHRYGSVTSLV